MMCYKARTSSRATNRLPRATIVKVLMVGGVAAAAASVIVVRGAI
jgi:hypothetical protein